jgi:hypothetical protein
MGAGDKRVPARWCNAGHIVSQLLDLHSRSEEPLVFDESQRGISCPSSADCEDGTMKPFTWM